jgi:hypothetical protein
MNLFDQIVLLLTGLVAVYLIWRFWGRYSTGKALYDVYYMMGFAVLFVSGVLLIFLRYSILGTPFVLTVASLIPLGIAMGIMEQYYPAWKKIVKWVLLVGILAIGIAAFMQLAALRRIAVPLFHGVAGIVIFLGPFFAKGAGKGFYWVGVGGALIGIGGLALASLSFGTPLFGIFTKELVMTILAPLLLLMSLAFAFGFMKDFKK